MADHPSQTPHTLKTPSLLSSQTPHTPKPSNVSEIEEKTPFIMGMAATGESSQTSMGQPPETWVARSSLSRRTPRTGRSVPHTGGFVRALSSYPASQAHDSSVPRRSLTMQFEAVSSGAMNRWQSVWFIASIVFFLAFFVCGCKVENDYNRSGSTLAEQLWKGKILLSLALALFLSCPVTYTFYSIVLNFMLNVGPANTFRARFKKVVFSILVVLCNAILDAAAKGKPIYPLTISLFTCAFLCFLTIFVPSDNTDMVKIIGLAYFEKAMDKAFQLEWVSFAVLLSVAIAAGAIWSVCHGEQHEATSGVWEMLRFLAEGATGWFSFERTVEAVEHIV